MSHDLPHACAAMEAGVADTRLPISYDPRLREYGIRYIDGSIQLMVFCPFCGATLPSSLRDAYFDRRDALGLDESEDPPEAMRSDTWWRDAGL